MRMTHKIVVMLSGLALIAALIGCGGATTMPGAGPSTATPVRAVRGIAFVEEITLLTMESFPVQIVVVAKGTLPDICTKIDQVSQNRVENVFTVTITTLSEQAENCPQTELLNRFEQSIPLEINGLPKGAYTVEVNGVSATFELASDNLLAADLAQAGNPSH